MGCGSVRGNVNKVKSSKDQQQPIREKVKYLPEKIEEKFSFYYQKNYQNYVNELEYNIRNIPKPERLRQNLDEQSSLMILEMIRLGNIKQIQEFYATNKEISLLEEVGNPNHYWTVLHFCTYFGYEELLGHLVTLLYLEDRENFHENLNLQTKEGFSLIMIASMLNHKGCVKQLFDHGGVNSDLIDNYYQTAYDHACYFNSYEALCLIQMFSVQASELNLEVIRKSDKKVEVPDLTEYTEVFQRNLTKKQPFDHGDTPPEDQGQMGTLRYRGEKAREILKECIRTNKKFIDHEFKQEIENVVSFPDQFTNIIWLRPHQIKKVREKDMYLYHKIDPIDIKHGINSVSTLTPIIAAISENPQLIMYIFNNLDINLYNIYSLQFYIDGKPTEVYLDDQVPCLQHLNSPLFMKIASHEIYPFLLEKAYAKITKNYFRAITSDPELILEEFLGSPIKSIWIYQQDESTLQKQLIRAIDNKRVTLLISTQDCSPKMGLHPNFVYPLVDYVKFKGDRYAFKVRSLYGRFDFQSQNNQDFQDWMTQNHPDRIKDQDLGYFYLGIEDIMQYFYYMIVSHYQQNYVYNHIEVECPTRKSQYISFKVEEKMKVCIRIHQPKDQPPQRVDLKLIREENNGNVSLQSENFSDGWQGKRTINVSSESVFMNLTPSVYYLRIKVYRYDGAEKTNLTVSSYSEKFNKLKIEDKVQGQFVYKQFLKNKIFSQLYNDNWNQIGFISSDKDNSWLELIGIENQGDSRIQATINIDDDKNSYFKGQQKKQKITLDINPKKKQFAVIKYKDHNKRKDTKWHIDFQDKFNDSQNKSDNKLEKSTSQKLQ